MEKLMMKKFVRLGAWLPVAYVFHRYGFSIKHTYAQHSELDEGRKDVWILLNRIPSTFSEEYKKGDMVAYW